MFPGSDETCNHRDDDCDGGVDEGLDGDLDGWSPCEFDCDDRLVDVFPGADEVCENGIDDDCDAEIDEVDCPEGDDDDSAAITPEPSCGCESSIERGPALQSAGLLAFGALLLRRRRARPCA